MVFDRLLTRLMVLPRWTNGELTCGMGLIVFFVGLVVKLARLEVSIRLCGLFPLGLVWGMFLFLTSLDLL